MATPVHEEDEDDGYSNRPLSNMGQHGNEMQPPLQPPLSPRTKQARAILNSAESDFNAIQEAMRAVVASSPTNGRDRQQQAQQRQHYQVKQQQLQQKQLLQQQQVNKNKGECIISHRN